MNKLPNDILAGFARTVKSIDASKASQIASTAIKAVVAPIVAPSIVEEAPKTKKARKKAKKILVRSTTVVATSKCSAQFGTIKRVKLVKIDSGSFVPQSKIISSDLDTYLENVASDDSVFTVSFKDIKGGSTVTERDENDVIIRSFFLSDKKEVIK